MVVVWWGAVRWWGGKVVVDSHLHDLVRAIVQVEARLGQGAERHGGDEEESF